ncbi:hypothetical protein N1851_020432 [Merluccius polli]|uniref:YqaJ viral recombinase domain-containing protein n=1 Tax=Merluccius polli TaxID=89951 RepID=A0AA47NX16_MERPO|nr:hypothetical protein N1851_020432 [Merluccius polli]
MARSIERATREQSSSAEWHSLRKMRLTSSSFREVCHARSHSSAENLAERICKGGVQTALMKRGLALEPVAIQEYAHIKNISYWPSGFIVHPDAPWLGTSPDGVVFDPMEAPPFGLVEMKCPNVKSYVDCGYLRMQNGALRLKPSHSYYWQVQGQLLITGMQWCDFVVFAEDVLVQIIFKDEAVARTSIRLCLPNIAFAHLFSVPEEVRPVNFTRNKVINNESLVHHDGHTLLQQLHNSRLFEDLTVTHGSCIQARQECDSTVGCHANHGLERGVRFVAEENFTLKEQRGWCLTEYLCTIKDDLCIRKICKLVAGEVSLPLEEHKDVYFPAGSIGNGSRSR